MNVECASCGGHLSLGLASPCKSCRALSHRDCAQGTKLCGSCGRSRRPPVLSLGSVACAIVFCVIAVFGAVVFPRAEFAPKRGHPAAPIIVPVKVSIQSDPDSVNNQASLGTRHSTSVRSTLWAGIEDSTDCHFYIDSHRLGRHSSLCNRTNHNFQLPDIDCGTSPVFTLSFARYYTFHCHLFAAETCEEPCGFTFEWLYVAPTLLNGQQAALYSGMNPHPADRYLPVGSVYLFDTNYSRGNHRSLGWND